MEKYIPILKRTKMFSGLNEYEIGSLIDCNGARLRTYKKGEYVLHQGEDISDIVVLVEGKLHIQRDDFWGNRSILGEVAVGEIFGEAYAPPDSGRLINDVVAVENSVVMCFDLKNLLTTCDAGCDFHLTVVHNLFFAISEKNRNLVQKLAHMSKRSTREKLISYLSEQARKNNSATFAIPFNRQQLADFLSVDRSAMSNELCKMRDEGLLEFDRNQFKLL